MDAAPYGENVGADSYTAPNDGHYDKKEAAVIRQLLR